MTGGIAAKVPVRERATTELREFVVIALYLYICFSALAYLKAAILQAQGIPFAPFGFAAVKALICAKFVLVGRALHLGERFKALPLIWPTLHRSLMFLVLLIILNALEEIIVGFMHHRSVGELACRFRRRHARSADCHQCRRAVDPDSLLRLSLARRGRRRAQSRARVLSAAPQYRCRLSALEPGAHNDANQFCDLVGDPGHVDVATRRRR